MLSKVLLGSLLFLSTTGCRETEHLATAAPLQMIGDPFQTICIGEGRYRNIIVSMDRGEILVNQDPVSRSILVGRLRDIFATRAEKTLFIADDQSPMMMRLVTDIRAGVPNLLLLRVPAEYSSHPCWEQVGAA